MQHFVKNNEFDNVLRNFFIVERFADDNRFVRRVVMTENGEMFFAPTNLKSVFLFFRQNKFRSYE